MTNQHLLTQRLLLISLSSSRKPPDDSGSRTHSGREKERRRQELYWPPHYIGNDQGKEKSAGSISSSIPWVVLWWHFNYSSVERERQTLHLLSFGSVAMLQHFTWKMLWSSRRQKRRYFWKLSYILSKTFLLSEVQSLENTCQNGGPHEHIFLWKLQQLHKWNRSRWAIDCCNLNT